MPEIKRTVEASLQRSLGAGRIASVAIKVLAENDETPVLDIVVGLAPGVEFVTAAESIAARTQIDRELRAQGENRFPSLLYLPDAA